MIDTYSRGIEHYGNRCKQAQDRRRQIISKIADLMRSEDDDARSPTHSEILKHQKELVQTHLRFNSAKRVKNNLACTLVKLMAKLTAESAEWKLKEIL